MDAPCFTRSDRLSSYRRIIAVSKGELFLYLRKDSLLVVQEVFIKHQQPDVFIKNRWILGQDADKLYPEHRSTGSFNSLSPEQDQNPSKKVSSLYSASRLAASGSHCHGGDAPVPACRHNGTPFLRRMLDHTNR